MLQPTCLPLLPPPLHLLQSHQHQRPAQQIARIYSWKLQVATKKNLSDEKNIFFQFWIAWDYMKNTCQSISFNAFDLLPEMEHKPANANHISIGIFFWRKCGNHPFDTLTLGGLLVVALNITGRRDRRATCPATVAVIANAMVGMGVDGLEGNGRWLAVAWVAGASAKGLAIEGANMLWTESESVWS